MKSHSAENRFQLYYYSNHALKDKSETLLTIDSRNKNVNNNYDDEPDDFDNEILDPLEKAIQTKYNLNIFSDIFPIFKFLDGLVQALTGEVFNLTCSLKNTFKKSNIYSEIMPWIKIDNSIERIINYKHACQSLDVFTSLTFIETKLLFYPPKALYKGNVPILTFITNN